MKSRIYIIHIMRKLGKAAEGFLTTDNEQSLTLSRENLVQITIASGMFGFTIHFALNGSGPAFSEGPLGFTVEGFSIPDALKLAEQELAGVDPSIFPPFSQGEETDEDGAIDVVDDDAAA